MSTWKMFEQAGGGVAVVIPSVHDAPSMRNAPMRARPTRVTALLSDHGRAGRNTGTSVSAELQVNGSAAAGHQHETGPIPIEDGLDITVQIAASEARQPLHLHARLGDEARALLAEPCYVAMFPSKPPVDVGALHVTDGQLRLSGSPLGHLDYALIRLVGSERYDLAALDDLEELRERLLTTYRTGSQGERERALRAALAEIAGHPRLLEADRERIATAFQREHKEWLPLPPVQRSNHQKGHGPSQGHVDWTEFVAKLPVGEPFEFLSPPVPTVEATAKGFEDAWRVPPGDSQSAPPEASAEQAARPAPKPVHWNTRILDGEQALAELFVTIGHAYTIETGLDPLALADALASSTIAPGGLPDGTKVTFELSCPQPILRGHDDAASEPAARVTYTGTYEAATGRCPPARFRLTPTALGRIPLTLGLVTDNAIRASTRLTLQAEPAAAQPAAAQRAVLAPSPGAAVASAVRPIDVSAAVLTGPRAELRLVLTPTDQLVISDGVVTEKPRDPASHQSVLIGEAIRARKELVALSGAYRRDPTRPSEFALADAPAMRLRMAKVGAALHKQFFGRPGDRATDLDVRNLAQVIADTPVAGDSARLQIAAAFQPFPWAVLYDGAYRGKPLTDDPASVDLACFWGHRFRIDRMIMGHASAARPPILAMPVRVQACLNPHLDDEPGAKALGVQVVGRQRALFAGMPGVTEHPRIESADGFVAYLDSETPCELLYVFCHASAAVTRDELFTYSDQAPETQAKLIFEPPPAPPIDVAAMQDHRTKPLVDRPLVFLNACSTTAGDEAFQAPLLEQFLDRWGAAGVLGTDWEVPSVFADAFARRLLAHFLRERKPLGEAFWLASHAAFDEGNPFPLVYALYAQPELTIAATSAAPKGREP